MVLCAVAKPRWDDATNTWWDGKVGMWPFTEFVPAARSSRNRPAGTPETKPVSVTRGIYKAMLLEEVLPAIKAKWPPSSSKAICVQQDNARPHVPADDIDVVAAGHADGWAIKMVCQPPNSPDTNVLDLGFFRALQSNQVKRGATTLDDIVQNVRAAWLDIPHSTLLSNFRTLQLVVGQILVHGGGNDFKPLHIGKDKLERDGRLPEQPLVDPQVVASAVANLDAEDEDAHTDLLAKELENIAAATDLCTALEELKIDDDIYNYDECDDLDAVYDLVSSDDENLIE